MAKLSILPNEVTKDQDTQNRQIYMAFNDIVSYSYNIASQNLADFSDSKVVTSTNTNYQNVPDYSFTFDTKNPLVQIIVNLALKGEGKIGFFIGNQVAREFYFNNTNENNMNFSSLTTLKTGKNTITIKWKAITGTITKSDKSSSFCQIISVNS